MRRVTVFPRFPPSSLCCKGSTNNPFFFPFSAIQALPSPRKEKTGGRWSILLSLFHHAFKRVVLPSLSPILLQERRRTLAVPLFSLIKDLSSFRGGDEKDHLLLFSGSPLFLLPPSGTPPLRLFFFFYPVTSCLNRVRRRKIFSFTENVFSPLPPGRSHFSLRRTPEKRKCTILPPKKAPLLEGRTVRLFSL